jgi:hypothetical protein
MRTTKSSVTFQSPFVLRPGMEELPPGRYDIETDEEEMSTVGRSAFRRDAIHLFVADCGSTRTIIITPAELESALLRDAQASPAIDKGGTEPTAAERSR